MPRHDTNPPPNPTTTDAIADLLANPASGKDEMNLAEFPIARLGRNDTRTSIEYHGQVYDKSGMLLEQKWIVSGSARFGMPTEFADRVLVALMAITAKENFIERKVPFTIYRVLQLLRLTHNQRNYRAVEKALQQLVGVTIYSEGAFWDKAQQKRITTKRGFHLLEEFWLKSFEADDAVIEAEGVNGYIVWGERIWDSFQAGYIKHLNTDFYYSLQNTIARRLFRFLDKRMHYQDEYQIDIFDLAARLGMKPYAYASHLARKLEPGLRELRALGYLAAAEPIKVGKFTRIRFVRAAVARGLLPADPALAAANYEDAADDEEDDDEPGDEHDGNVENGKWGNDRRGNDSVVTGAGRAAGAAAPLAALYAEYATPPQLKSLWVEILAEFAGSLPSATFAMLNGSALLAVTAAAAVVAIDGGYRDWIERQLGRQILSLLNRSLETEVKITELRCVNLPAR